MILTRLTQLFRRKPAQRLPQVIAVDPKLVTPADRQRLREWLREPVTQLAFQLLEASRPTVFVQKEYRESRLMNLQGWETYRNSLLGIGLSPEEIKQIIEEQYTEEEK